jgi:ankyrin repeat protein
MLEELPETLDETYERILRDVNKATRDHAHRLLQCLTVAVRPLRVAELAEVLAVDFGAPFRRGTSKLNTDWRWEDQERAVLSTCSSLISIVDRNGSQVVQFSHFSVKEFLTSSRLADSSGEVSRFHILLEPAHTILAKACLGVLLRLDEHVDRHNVEDGFPLARYAAEYWVEHAQFEQVSSHVREGMEDLFDPVKPCFAAWLRVHDRDVYRQARSFPLSWFRLYGKRAAAPLYYAALCGFHDLAKHLITKHPKHVNASGGYYLSPLAVALEREHFDVAQLLYENGANVGIQGRFGRTLLYSATAQKHREIVEWLLSHGADPNQRCGGEDYPQTPLHFAASRGLVEFSQILLQHKADQNAQDSRGRTPLHLASGRGRINVARLLLERGVDVNAQDNKRSTALHLAADYGYINVARLLLEHGVDVNAQDGHRSTALHLASEYGYINVARLLLEHGVNVNAQDNKRSTALHLASEYGHINVARLLLEHGVDVNAQDNKHSTALHAASRSGNLEVARLLLEHGADLDAENGSGRTSLQVVSEQ